MTRDARCYRMRDPSVEDEIIIEQIESGSRVIDLGCGDGRLLDRLRAERGCAVQGVELDLDEYHMAINRGLAVIRADLDEPLQVVPDASFDFAVLSQTLQQVRHPKALLVEMLRVARRAVIVVPNFAHWRVRFEVMVRGRAPVTETLPYEWYETPNLHVMSMADFRDLVRMLNLRIVLERPIIRGRAVDRAWSANLRADSAFYVLERNNN